MKYIAEITLRTVPFYAEDAEEARFRAQEDLRKSLAVLYEHPAQVVEVQVYEHEDVDG